MSDTGALLESIGVNLKRRGTVPVASPSTDTDALLKSIGVNLKQPVAQPAPTPVDTDALLKSIGVKRQSDATFDSDTMLSMDNLARQIRATPLAPPEPPAPPAPRELSLMELIARGGDPTLKDIPQPNIDVGNKELSNRAALAMREHARDTGGKIIPIPTPPPPKITGMRVGAHGPLPTFKPPGMDDKPVTLDDLLELGKDFGRTVADTVVAAKENDSGEHVDMRTGTQKAWDALVARDPAMRTVQKIVTPLQPLAPIGSVAKRVIGAGTSVGNAILHPIDFTMGVGEGIGGVVMDSVKGLYHRIKDGKPLTPEQQMLKDALDARDNTPAGQRDKLDSLISDLAYAETAREHQYDDLPAGMKTSVGAFKDAKDILQGVVQPAFRAVDTFTTPGVPAKELGRELGAAGANLATLAGGPVGRAARLAVLPPMVATNVLDLISDPGGTLQEHPLRTALDLQATAHGLAAVPEAIRARELRKAAEILRQQKANDIATAQTPSEETAARMQPTTPYVNRYEPVPEDVARQKDAADYASTLQEAAEVAEARYDAEKAAYDAKVKAEMDARYQGDKAAFKDWLEKARAHVEAQHDPLVTAAKDVVETEKGAPIPWVQLPHRDTLPVLDWFDRQIKNIYEQAGPKVEERVADLKAQKRAWLDANGFDHISEDAARQELQFQESVQREAFRQQVHALRDLEAEANTTQRADETHAAHKQRKVVEEARGDFVAARDTAKATAESLIRDDVAKAYEAYEEKYNALTPEELAEPVKPREGKEHDDYLERKKDQAKQKAADKIVYDQLLADAKRASDAYDAEVAKPIGTGGVSAATLQTLKKAAEVAAGKAETFRFDAAKALRDKFGADIRQLKAASDAAHAARGLETPVEKLNREYAAEVAAIKKSHTDTMRRDIDAAKAVMDQRIGAGEAIQQGTNQAAYQTRMGEDDFLQDIAHAANRVNPDPSAGVRSQHQPEGPLTTERAAQIQARPMDLSELELIEKDPNVVLPKDTTGNVASYEAALAQIADLDRQIKNPANSAAQIAELKGLRDAVAAAVYPHLANVPGVAAQRIRAEVEAAKLNQADKVQAHKDRVQLARDAVEGTKQDRDRAQNILTLDAKRMVEQATENRRAHMDAFRESLRPNVDAAKQLADEARAKYEKAQAAADAWDKTVRSRLKRVPNPALPPDALRTAERAEWTADKIKLLPWINPYALPVLLWQRAIAAIGGADYHAMPGGTAKWLAWITNRDRPTMKRTLDTMQEAQSEGIAALPGMHDSLARVPLELQPTVNDWGHAHEQYQTSGIVKFDQSAPVGQRLSRGLDKAAWDELPQDMRDEADRIIADGNKYDPMTWIEEYGKSILDYPLDASRAMINAGLFGQPKFSVDRYEEAKAKHQASYEQAAANARDTALDDIFNRRKKYEADLIVQRKALRAALSRVSNAAEKATARPDLVAKKNGIMDRIKVIESVLDGLDKEEATVHRDYAKALKAGRTAAKQMDAQFRADATSSAKAPNWYWPNHYSDAAFIGAKYNVLSEELAKEHPNWSPEQLDKEVRTLLDKEHGHLITYRDPVTGAVEVQKSPSDPALGTTSGPKKKLHMPDESRVKGVLERNTRDMPVEDRHKLGMTRDLRQTMNSLAERFNDAAKARMWDKIGQDREMISPANRDVDNWVRIDNQTNAETGVKPFGQNNPDEFWMNPTLFYDYAMLEAVAKIHRTWIAKLMKAFKMKATVLTPASTIGDFIGNTFFLGPMAGFNPYDPTHAQSLATLGMENYRGHGEWSGLFDHARPAQPADVGREGMGRTQMQALHDVHQGAEGRVRDFTGKTAEYIAHRLAQLKQGIGELFAKFTNPQAATTQVNMAPVWLVTHQYENLPPKLSDVAKKGLDVFIHARGVVDEIHKGAAMRTMIMRDPELRAVYKSGGVRALKAPEYLPKLREMADEANRVYGDTENASGVTRAATATFLGPAFLTFAMQMTKNFANNAAKNPSRFLLFQHMADAYNRQAYADGLPDDMLYEPPYYAGLTKMERLFPETFKGAPDRIDLNRFGPFGLFAPRPDEGVGGVAERLGTQNPVIDSLLVKLLGGYDTYTHRKIPTWTERLEGVNRAWIPFYEAVSRWQDARHQRTNTLRGVPEDPWRVALQFGTGIRTRGDTPEQLKERWMQSYANEMKSIHQQVNAARKAYYADGNEAKLRELLQNIREGVAMRINGAPMEIRAAIERSLQGQLYRPGNEDKFIESLREQRKVVRKNLHRVE